MPSQKVGTPSASALQPLKRAVEQGAGRKRARRPRPGCRGARPTRVAATASCRVAGRRCADEIEHRLAAVDRGAEIAGAARPSASRVLHEHGTVEAELLRRRGDLFRRRVLADDRRDGTARNRIDHRPRSRGMRSEATGRSCRSRRAMIADHGRPPSRARSLATSWRSSSTAVRARPMVSNDRIVSVSTRPGSTA